MLFKINLAFNQINLMYLQQDLTIWSLQGNDFRPGSDKHIPLKMSMWLHLNWHKKLLT